MAVNQHHMEDQRDGVIIPPGESILMRYEDVELSFSNMSDSSNLFRSSRKGQLYLTQYRVIFVASRRAKDALMSFMMPFNLMSNYTVEQPAFGSNYLKGTISAAPNGGWEGQGTFKLTFRSGGAIEFGRLMIQCASNAAKGLPPPVTVFGFSPQASLFLAVNARGVPSGQTQVIYVMPNNSAYMPSSSGYQIAATAVPGFGVPPPGYGPPLGYGSPPPGYVPPPPGFVPPPPGFVPPPHGFMPPLLHTEPQHFPMQGLLLPRPQTLTLPTPKPLQANQNPKAQNDGIRPGAKTSPAVHHSGPSLGRQELRLGAAHLPHHFLRRWRRSIRQLSCFHTEPVACSPIFSPGPLSQAPWEYGARQPRATRSKCGHHASGEESLEP
ncbi:LOW QUALITY PROTEIN: postacrosomal sheath WW domain-binding protein [Trichosurus vulpecula]|uniref:LOW QUALITY PROTEIN: postacrosomal sheath WW domain-binding protein n=1 Tax=Trichosurus vulpecula TaxID=9337 RepID=UPI00186AFE6F|nr:LOW QUALITY PROTEIN: postacrosomal sheath WW domain-binding protein [Trichosurus vulpecula]